MYFQEHCPRNNNIYKRKILNYSVIASVSDVAHYPVDHFK